MGDQVTIVGSGVVVESTQAMFPGLVRVGHVLVASFSTVADGWPGGQIAVTRSIDNGASWSAPRVVADPDGGSDSVVGALGLTALRNGVVLLPFNGVRWTPGAGTAGRIFTLHLLRSTDSGDTWSGGEAIDVPFYSPAVYGKLLELPDGRLLWPVYGQQKPGERWRSVIIESVDGGQSWEILSQIAFDPHARLDGPYAHPAFNGERDDGNPDVQQTVDPRFRPHCSVDGFNETTVVDAGSGRLLAVLRQQGVGGDSSLQFFHTASSDDGQTWDPVKPLEISGTSPLLHYGPYGRMLFAYRRFAPDTGQTAPGVDVRVWSEIGSAWGNPVTLTDPYGYSHETEFQCGYPAMANLPDAEVMVAFYSYRPGHGRFVAWNRLSVPEPN